MRKADALVLTALIMLLIVTPLRAQNEGNDVHLFQSYFYDAPIAKVGYGQGGFLFADYDYANSFNLGVMGGYPINEKIEVGTQLYYVNYSPENGNGQSGISDLGAFGRYNVYNEKQINISTGAMLTLPIGSEDVGQGDFNFGAYGAIRYSLQNKMALVGTLGLFFIENINDKRDSFLLLGFGTIYPVNPQLNIVGELHIWSENDYMMLSGGADYMLGSGRLRGALGLGLDDGAPDIMLIGSYSISLSK